MANHDGGEPAMESAALVPGPPAATPPPWTDEGSLHLLEILRLHVRGVPRWMIPRYIITGVDLYDREPEELLRAHPSAASADGKTALYFLNVVRAKAKTDGRKCRMAPGGTWKSERAAVDIWGASRIAGTRQSLSFITKGPEGEDLRSGYIAQELALAGGDQLVLTKVYFTPRGEEAVSQAKERVIAKARRKKTTASSSRAPLPPAAASPEPGKTPAPVAAASPAPSKTPAPVAASSPAPGKTPAPVASASPAPPKKAASSSSSPAPIDQAASDSSAGRSTPSTRWLLLEVGDSPVSQGQDFSWRKIHGAAELVGSSLPLNKRKLLRFDSEGLFLFEEGTKKMFPSSP